MLAALAVVPAVIRHADGRISEEITDLRWSPLNEAMLAASSWWVKGPLFIAAALVADLLAIRALGRVRAPLIAVVTLGSVLVASLASTLAKELFDRARPPLADLGISAIGSLPSSPSFPSGHATTAFAAAAALALLRPSLRWWAVGLAAGVAVSRVYLGVHFAGDVVAGALLGATIGVALVLVARRLVPGVDARLRPTLGLRALAAAASHTASATGPTRSGSARRTATCAGGPRVARHFFSALAGTSGWACYRGRSTTWRVLPLAPRSMAGMTRSSFMVSQRSGTRSPIGRLSWT